MRVLTATEVAWVSGGNSCGPEGSWLTSIIPQSWGGVSFAGACARHDQRYSPGSGMSRAEPDQRFLNEMLSAAGGNVLAMAGAYLYFGMVSLFGGLFYEGDKPAGSTNEAPTAEQASFMVNSDSIRDDFWRGETGMGHDPWWILFDDDDGPGSFDPMSNPAEDPVVV